MNKIMQSLMLSCAKASELIDKKSLFELSFKDGIQLKMHTSMCNACNAYIKQSQLLDEFLQNISFNKTPDQLPTISNPELKNKILSKI